MNNLQKYNRIVFAIVATLILIWLIIFGIIFLVDEFRTYDYDDNTLIVEKELDSLKRLNLRNQIVSLEGIRAFDSASNTYLIPVNHKRLKDSQSREGNIIDLLDTKSSKAGSYYHGYGNYNNFVLYNFNTLESSVLLDRRVNINEYDIYISKKKSLLVMTGWEEDTNEDGKLREGDLEQLFIYDHSIKEIKQVQNNQFEIINFTYLPEVDKVVLKVTSYESDVKNPDERPEILVTYSSKTNSLEPLVSIEEIERLQNIIDN